MAIALLHSDSGKHIGGSDSRSARNEWGLVIEPSCHKLQSINGYWFWIIFFVEFL